MKTTTQRQTASQGYKTRLAEVQKQMARIQDTLTTHVDGKLHWGHVGDWGYLVAELKSTADFIAGEGE